MGIVGGNSHQRARDQVAFRDPGQDRLPCDLRPPLIHNIIARERKRAAKNTQPTFTATRTKAALNKAGFVRFAGSCSHFITSLKDVSPEGENNA